MKGSGPSGGFRLVELGCEHGYGEVVEWLGCDEIGLESCEAVESVRE